MVSVKIRMLPKVTVSMLLFAGLVFEEGCQVRLLPSSTGVVSGLLRRFVGVFWRHRDIMKLCVH